MKNVCLRLSLIAVLSAAVAVPVIGHGAKAADAQMLGPAGLVVEAPTQMANGGPTPWPKKPVGAGAVVTTPLQMANGGPTPWPKKPVGIRS